MKKLSKEVLNCEKRALCQMTVTVEGTLACKFKRKWDVFLETLTLLKKTNAG